MLDARALALRPDEPLLEALTEPLEEGVLFCEQDVVRYGNRAAARLLRAGESTLTGSPLGLFFDPETLVHLQHGLASRWFSGWLRRFDGTWAEIALRATTSARAGESSQQPLVIWLSEGAAQSETERRFSQVVDSAPNGVVMIDAEGRIVLVNPELERMFGYEAGVLLRQPIERLLPERFRAAHGAMREGYWKAPQPRAMGADRELLGRRADGTEFPIEIGLNSVQTPEGQRVVAAVVDISSRKRMELAFRNVVEAAPYGMLIVDKASTIVLANRRLGELFGYLASDLIGRPLSSLLPARYRERHGDHVLGYRIAPSLRAMGPGRDLTGQHRDGTEFPIEIGLNPLEWQGTLMTLAGVTDISVRKKMELEIRQANSHLEEFSYVASHDLKSPLRGISDLIEWIAEDLGERASSEITHNLERVKVRVQRMETIIEDLLSYARASRASTEFVTVEPRTLIDAILELQPFPPGIEVRTEVDVDSFKAARIPLETVLRNLISNAVKHHDRPQGTIAISVTADDSFCVFSVADDGPGIPRAAQERVFKLFQTVSASQRQGSGIGLALANRLVECHGGRIALESWDGQRGTTFRVWWPRFQKRAPDE